MARIVALPVPCALVLWGNETGLWVAFVVATLLGATDFVDGYMARRDGTTLLGALLDPVADKLFVAALLLPIAALGDCPGWAAGLLFTRELLITALRSSMALRKEQLTTSQLGKLKTVVQMGGLATYFITLFVPSPAMQWVHLAGFLVLAVLAVVLAVRKRGWPPVWILGGAPLWLLVLGLALALEPRDAAFFQFMIMVAFSWISAFDYLVGAWARLAKTGLTRADVSRVLQSVAVGMGAVPVVAEHPAAVIPILIALSGELSLGGIDNVITAERGRASRGTFLPVTILSVLLGALAWSPDALGTHAGMAVLATSIALALVSVGNAVVAFLADKDVFLAASAQGPTGG